MLQVCFLEGGQFVGDEETPFLFFAQMIFLCLANQSRRDIATSFVGLLCTEICLKTNITLVPKKSKWPCHFDVGDSFLWLYQALLEQDQFLSTSHSSYFRSLELLQSH